MRTGTSGSHASKHRSVAVGREGIVLRIPIFIPEYLFQVEKCPTFHFFFLIRNHSFDPIFFFTDLENVLRSSFMNNFEYNISKTFNSLSSVFAHMASRCGKFATKWSVYNIRKEYNSHRTGLGHNMAQAFVLVLGHQHGNRDVMWKRVLYRVEMVESDLMLCFVCPFLFRCISRGEERITILSKMNYCWGNLKRLGILLSR